MVVGSFQNRISEKQRHEFIFSGSPCIHAYLASESADQEQILSILQCFFYPLLVPFLRNKTREAKRIEVLKLKVLSLFYLSPKFFV